MTVIKCPGCLKRFENGRGLSMHQRRCPVLDIIAKTCFKKRQENSKKRLGLKLAHQSKKTFMSAWIPFSLISIQTLVENRNYLCVGLKYCIVKFIFQLILIIRFHNSAKKLYHSQLSWKYKSLHDSGMNFLLPLHISLMTMTSLPDPNLMHVHHFEQNKIAMAFFMNTSMENLQLCPIHTTLSLIYRFSLSCSGSI